MTDLQHQAGPGSQLGGSKDVFPEGMSVLESLICSDSDGRPELHSGWEQHWLGTIAYEPSCPKRQGKWQVNHLFLELDLTGNHRGRSQALQLPSPLLLAFKEHKAGV